MVLFFRLKSAHRACGMGPSVGMRNADANELQSTPCVTGRNPVSCDAGHIRNEDHKVKMKG